MHRPDINDLATDAGGAVRGLKQFQVKFHFQIDDKKIVGPTVAGDAPVHSKDGPRAGRDENLVQKAT